MSKLTKKMFRWNRSLHRDVGYLCAVITVIYGISGITVNHIDDWNPSYDIKRIEAIVDSLVDIEDEQFIPHILKQLDIKESYKGGYQPSPNEYKIFLESSVVELNLDSKTAVYEKVVKRPVLYQFNFLHLNHAKAPWTYIADVYAVLLVYLAISGMFMVKGRNGFWKRGIWLFLPGLLICIWGLFL